MSHISQVCKEFLCLDTNKETTYAFYKRFRVWKDNVGHKEWVSGKTLQCRYEAVPESMATQRSVLVRELCKEFKTADGKVLKAAAR